MVDIKISNKSFFVIVLIVILLVITGFSYAAWTSKAVYHSAGDIKLTIGTEDYSLQEAVNNDLITTKDYVDTAVAAGDSGGYTNCTGVCCSNEDCQCPSGQGYTRVHLLATGNKGLSPQQTCVPTILNINPELGGEWRIDVSEARFVGCACRHNGAFCADNNAVMEYIKFNGICLDSIICYSYVSGNQQSSCAVCCK